MGLKKLRNYGKMAKKAAGVMAPKKAVKKAVVQANTKVLTKLIKKVVNKDIEDKCVQNQSLIQQANIPGAGLTSTGLGVLSPVSIVLSQGTNEASRIGNQIEVKKFNLRYSIYALPSTEAAGINPFRGLPFLVRVVVYRHRYNMGDSSPDALIDMGSTNTFLNGDIDTYFRPYNKDEYSIVYSKTHRLQPIRHLGTTAYAEVNQDTKATSFVIRNIDLKAPKIMKFNDNNQQPTNYNYYIGFSVCNVDGSAITTSQTRATVNAESTLYFQDA